MEEETNIAKFSPDGIMAPHGVVDKYEDGPVTLTINDRGEQNIEVDGGEVIDKSWNGLGNILRVEYVLYEEKYEEKSEEDDTPHTPVVVTLEESVAVPGSNHYPSDVQTFRCREHGHGDEFMTFYGVNVGPEHTVLTVRNDNIRGIAMFDVLGDDE